MEPLTKSDLKDLLAEFRSEIRQSIAEAFGTWKPAFEAQASGLQVAVDLLEQHACRDKCNSTEEASLADPLDPLALKASITPPTTTGGVIPVLAASAASDRTFDDKAASTTPTPTTERSLADTFVVPSDTATPPIVERGPQVVLPASTGFITTTPTTCSMEGLVGETTDSRSASASTTVPKVHTATSDIQTVLAASTSSDGTFDGQAISGVVSSPATCLMVCLPRHPVAASLQVASSPPIPKEYALDTIRIRVAAVPMAMTGEFRPISSQPIASKVHVHRPMPWPSFLDGHADGDEERPLPWPSFSVICDSLRSELEESVAMNTMRMSVTSDDQFSSAIQDASHWPRYIVTGSQMNLVLTAASRATHWLVFDVCDDSTVSSLIVVLWDEWVLQPWDSGQQADFSYDQFTCANHYTSCFPGNFVTGGQIEDFVACSTLHLFLSGFSVSFRPVVMLDLQIVRFVTYHAWLSQWFILMYWPEEQLLATRPLPIASCSVPNNMFSCWHKLQSLLYASELDRAKLIGMFHEFENWGNYMENLQLVRLTWASEQEALSRGLQFRWCMSLYLVQGLFFLAAPTVTCTPVLSLSNIMIDGHLHNQGTLTCPAAVCITELEGTIGGMETTPFIEALHQLSFSLVVKAVMHSTVVCLLKLPIQCVASSDFKDEAATSAPEAHATMQLLVIEVYRHDLGLGVAYTQEFNTDTPGRVLLYMPEVPVIIDPECQIVLMSFCEKTRQLGFLLQEGCQDRQFVHSALDRVHPILLLVHADHQSYDQTTFQGGRDARAITSFYRHSDSIKVRRLQWDPGGFSAMSAWGQAEFEGGRDVSNIACLQLVGLPTWADNDGPSPDNPPRAIAATYILQEAIKRAS